MDRLSDWRAAAWVAFCLAALAAAAALIVPAALRKEPAPKAKPVIRASLTPRTHLFGQPVTATVEVPAGFRVRTAFAPYRVLRRSVTRTPSGLRFQFTLDCLRAKCVGRPGAEHEVALPPARIVLPDGRQALGLWPRLRQASRLGPNDLRMPALRGDLTSPAREQHGASLLEGLLFAAAAGLALLGAAAFGFAWLGWRATPAPLNGAKRLSVLDYALLVTGLAAGSGQENRRAALESLAIALDERGLGDLAARARDLAWSPEPPRGEAVRQLATEAQQATRTAG